jgi:DHA2 family multidrug resistance protein
MSNIQPTLLDKKSLLILTIGMGLGTFIQVLDSSIANVSIPAIAGSLGASVHEASWVITSFVVSNAVVLPLSGWLSKRFGEVNLFIYSTILFALTSWLCAEAASLYMLILFRILQGAVAGSLIPLSQSILLANYPPEKKGLALGLWSMVVIIAPIVGPVLGGWITDYHGWPWIFYINIPLGFLSAFLTYNVLGHKKIPADERPIDKIGFVILVIAVSSLQIFLDKGNELDWFDSHFISGLCIISIVAFIAFIAWELYYPYPIVNLSFFKKRSFVVGSVLTSLGFMMFFGSTVLVPVWLQTQMNYTAFWAGIALAPIGAFSLILMPLIGKNLHRINLQLVISFSFLIFAITFHWFSLLNTQASLAQIITPRLFQGIALACFFLPLTTMSLSELPKEETASAAGVFNFVRLVIGGGGGASIFVTIWSRRQTVHQNFLWEIASKNRSYLNSSLLTEENPLSNQIIAHLIAKQSGMLAINDIFYLCSILSIVLAVGVWIARPKTNHVQHQVSAE